MSLKALLKDIADPGNFLSLNKIYIQLCEGDHMAAFLLGQLIYWSDRATNGEGWIAKSSKEWHDELLMSQYQVTRAAKKLAEINIGFEKDKRRSKFHKSAPTMHYKIDQEKLFQSIMKLYGFEEVDYQETSQSDYQEPSQSFHTETTTETTKTNSDSKSESESPPPAAEPDKKSFLQDPEPLPIPGNENGEQPDTPPPPDAAAPPPPSEPLSACCGKPLMDSTIHPGKVCSECGEPVKAIEHPPLPESLTNPHCNRKHLTACLAWALDNYNYEAIQRPLNMLLGKDGAGEWHAHRLSPDNADNPNKGPVTDYELIAFGAWLRMKYSLSSEYRKYRPQTAEKIARNMELFRGEREYAMLVNAAQNGHPQVAGIDEMIQLNMNGSARSDAIAALGMHLARPVSPGSHAPPPPPKPDPEASEEQWATPEQMAELRALQAEVFAAKRVENLGLELDED